MMTNFVIETDAPLGPNFENASTSSLVIATDATFLYSDTPAADCQELCSRYHDLRETVFCSFKRLHYKYL